MLISNLESNVRCALLPVANLRVTTMFEYKTLGKSAQFTLVLQQSVCTVIGDVDDVDFWPRIKVSHINLSLNRERFRINEKV